MTPRERAEALARKLVTDAVISGRDADDLTALVADALREAALEERERCVGDVWRKCRDAPVSCKGAEHLEAAIRARGSA